MPQKETIKITLFYLISAGFIFLNAWFVIHKETLLLSALPLLLGILLLAVFSFEKIIYIIVFFVPLSVPLSYFMPWLTFDLYLPTEPLLMGVLILFILKVVHERNFDKKILTHPVSLAIFVNLAWILITAATSTMPAVSFKFLLARMWFVVAFYFLAIKIFSGKKNMERYVWLYLIPLLMVIFYTTYRHAGYGLLDKQAAHYVVSPFYNDHTAYGAALAFYLPFTVLFAFHRVYSKKVKRISLIFLAILLIALVLSYSRAAWVSVIAATAAWILIKLRIRFKPLFITAVLLLGLVFSFQTQIVMHLERNTVKSSSNLLEHVSSISNISSDASNLERINRWKCALRMFEEKPLFGFGPGTYMFQYAPYQVNKERTIISTNIGDKGNAHSEYLGPLSESGIPGLITFLLIIITVIYSGIHAWSRLTDARMKGILLAALTGLITYYVHGFLNNFLDTDKLSVPFWGFTAMIVAADLYSRQQANRPGEGKKNPAE